MRCFNAAAALVLLASPVLAQRNTDCVNPTSDLGVEFYAQGQFLARVPTSKIRNQKAYRLFAGLDNDGNPRWTANFEKRRPVFTDHGNCYRPEVVFNPGIGRYLLLTATSGAPRWAGTDEKYLGIFESSTPWGRWRTVKQIHGWGGDENRFQPRIPFKWISDDGKSFYLLYSCFPEGPYQFNVRKCMLELRGE